LKLQQLQKERADLARGAQEGEAERRGLEERLAAAEAEREALEARLAVCERSFEERVRAQQEGHEESAQGLAVRLAACEGELARLKTAEAIPREEAEEVSAPRLKLSMFGGRGEASEPFAIGRISGVSLRAVPQDSARTALAEAERAEHARTLREYTSIQVVHA
jgi:hypothetical protein